MPYHDDHDHGGHDGHVHSHGASERSDQRYVAAALVLLVSYMTVEYVAYRRTHSLALASDAAHMLSDSGAIALSLIVVRAKRYYPRSEPLSALVNGASLIASSMMLGVEAMWRVRFPAIVNPTPVFWVSCVGIVVNLAVAMLMSQADRESINIRGAYLHVLTDMYGFIATATSALIIARTGWLYADAVATLVVAFIMVRSGALLCAQAVSILRFGDDGGLGQRHTLNFVLFVLALAAGALVTIVAVRSGTISPHSIVQNPPSPMMPAQTGP